jgi:hypothetical protein
VCSRKHRVERCPDRGRDAVSCIPRRSQCFYTSPEGHSVRYWCRSWKYSHWCQEQPFQEHQYPMGCRNQLSCRTEKMISRVTQRGLEGRKELLTWPQISQHALRGQVLSWDKSVPAAGFAVPGTCGPQTAFATTAGIGGLPVLRHMMAWA